MIAPAGRDRPRALATRVVLGFLLAYTAWAWGGLRPSFHEAGVAAAGILLAAVLVESRWASWRAMRRDPVFILGLVFLGYLAIQWLNAGRTQYFDVGYQRWAYTKPPWPHWPSAFTRPDAAQMLAWFFPAWAIAVTVRTRTLDRHALRGLLMFAVCNAAVLAAFGLIQFASGTRSIYWMQPLKSHFFASFAYGNHAAPFFVLAGGVAAGLLYREIFDIRRSHADTPSALSLRHPRRVVVLVPVLVLCLVGANMGFSRTGVILAGMLVVFVAAYGWMRGWRLLQPAGRLNFMALSLAVLGGFYFIVAGFGEQGIRTEFAPKPVDAGVPRTAWDRVSLELGGRPQYVRAAVAIWKEHPWFGVGGWGYKYLVASHVPESQWAALEKKGWANVHCDALQFLAEFGLVGFGLLLGAFGAVAREWVASRKCRHDALWMMGAATLGLVVVFSVVDLPFRNPAILYTWVVALAAIPRICEIRPCGKKPAVAGNGLENGWAAESAAERGMAPGKTGP